MEMGDMDSLTPDETENAIYLLDRALRQAVGWYIRTCEKHDDTKYTDRQYDDMAERLVDIAITDAHALVMYEAQNPDALNGTLERDTATLRCELTVEPEVSKYFDARPKEPHTNDGA